MTANLPYRQFCKLYRRKKKAEIPNAHNLILETEKPGHKLEIINGIFKEQKAMLAGLFQP